MAATYDVEVGQLCARRALGYLIAKRSPFFRCTLRESAETWTLLRKRRKAEARAAAVTSG